MNTIPQITTVAELQRNYRPLVNEIKKTGNPLFVLSNGKPDVVVIEAGAFQAQVQASKELEEMYLASQIELSRQEMKAGKKKLLRSLSDLD